MEKSQSSKATGKRRAGTQGPKTTTITSTPAQQSSQNETRATVTTIRLAQRSRSSKRRLATVGTNTASVEVQVNDPPPSVDPEPIHQPIEPPRAKRPPRRAADNTRDWVPFRPWFLDELIRHDGLGRSATSAGSWCTKCQGQGRQTPGEFKCLDCDVHGVVCRQCILEDHKMRCLHVIERWNGTFFERTSLRSLGLTVQLGHDGGACPYPGRRKMQFVVCHTNGYHEVDVRFCGCVSSDDGLVAEWAQLMRFGWYPASRQRIETAFTFKVLDLFHEMTLQGKISLYDFDKTLCRITDNSGTRSPPIRYKQFAIVVRQWRNLMLLKRSGRGHDAGGIENTKEGECAVECAACPHPGRNLPADWATAPANVAWQYVLYLMLDANFRLKLKDRGFDDIELSSGWAYFVEDSKYRSFVELMGDQQETNTCSAEHKAIRNANVPHGGYSVSGTAACLCNRHTLVRRNGLADLQKGERYCTMDYILMCTLTDTEVSIFLTYDIACQYSKNFARRVANFPPNMRLDEKRTKSMRWAIPKKHWRVHGELNHSQFSLNYLIYCGRTYGEGIETGWSHMNPVSMSTKEMAPAARRELLDDHWNSWNWQKTLRFGELLLRRLREAYDMMLKHQTMFDDFSKTFSQATLSKWQADVERWEADPFTSPDPFVEQEISVTLADVKLELANEDAAEVASGIPSPHEVTASAFLQIGIELEDSQRSLRFRAKTKKSTADRASLQVKRNTLMNRIDAWRKIQAVYMPCADQLVQAWNQEHADDDADDDGDPDADDDDANNDANDAAVRVRAEDVPLYLPSALPPHLRNDRALASLMRKETRFRVAIADDSLAEIRRLRRMLVGVAQFKQLNVSGTGQKPNTRVRNLYSKFQDKITVAIARYRDAYATLSVLQPGGPWSDRLRVLADKDVSGPGNDDDDRPLGEGRREISWIWLVARPTAEGDNVGEEFNECMKIEWTKTRARAQRWAEEVQLLQEEMRRVLAFFEWKAQWWLERRDQREELSIALQSGVTAYAEKQAHMFRELAIKFRNMWVPFFTVRRLHAEWAAAQMQHNEHPVTPPADAQDRARRGNTDSEDITENSESDDENVL